MASKIMKVGETLQEVHRLNNGKRVVTYEGKIVSLITICGDEILECDVDLLFCATIHLAGEDKYANIYL